jgi:hypothetical protein
MTPDEMRNFLGRLYDAWAAGDASMFEATTSDDFVGIGTDPDEFWSGRETFLPIAKAQLSEMREAGLVLRGGSAEVFAQGPVAWAVDRPTIALADGSTLSARFTVIASGSGDNVALHHIHLSLGAGNEDVLGETLST